MLPARHAIPICGAAVTLALLGQFSANPSLTSSAILILAAAILVLSKVGEPPALAFACFMQWLQASMKIFHADYLGVRVEAMFGGGEIRDAIWLSLASVAVLAVGMALGRRLLDSGAGARPDEPSPTLDVRRLFVAFLIGIAGGQMLDTLAWVVPQLTQILVAFQGVQWILYFLLAHTILIRRRGYPSLAGATVIAVVVGFAGVFAEWKEPFYVLGLAYLTHRAKGSRFLPLGAVVAVAVTLAVAWTAIKSDYRDFLSTNPPIEQRIGKAWRLIVELDADDMSRGVEATALRIAYVDYFALTLRRVPRLIPHEEGALWKGAVMHVLKPRLFFPEKSALVSDSVLTAKYTGVNVAGSESGATSIGLGYVAESYIDFGRHAMFGAVLALGLLFGAAFGYFARAARFRTLGFAIGSALMVVNATSLATSNVKLVGGTLMGVIVMGLALRLAERPLVRWLGGSTPPRTRARAARRRAESAPASPRQ